MSLNTSSTGESAPSQAPPNPMRIATILNGPEGDNSAAKPNPDTAGDLVIRGIIDLAIDTEDSESETNSTSSSDTGTQRKRSRQPRLPCKKYAAEQAYWIWYHRTDLGEGWDEVEQKFDIQFGESRKKGGLQCKFYRLLDIHGVEKVRKQTKSGHKRRGNRVGKFGVVQRTTRRYAWM
ncbi:hypothetical protein G647_00615 [Cladophialophora carrionii CBS 160.54]|uniref:Uncharacterized protein n=1 Tax=Cladophialophora carrionii CBS 160.54 TaxID=1279043 RepID=V9DNB4_9EURO|nr:uncharacterized protein G647_00615 [Cladophialophora carrionii CBS 160.54]ETI28166.1 hypothetical protein G647_00615 [Cladophialophora carrionii CBS 160.54]